MIKWLRLLIGTVRSALRSQRDLVIENLVLRQQLAILAAAHPRPRLRDTDRLFWVLISRAWSGWRAALQIVRPETVVRWHRQGFRYYWRWKSRGRGRPSIDAGIRVLIRRMSRSNPLWGAPRIHGELLKLGIEVSETTVAKYMIQPSQRPSPGWRAFLGNHAGELIALDFFTVPTLTFRVLFVLVILSHDRRRILHLGVTAQPSAAWTGRQLRQACRGEITPHYLIRDWDGIYGEAFSREADTLGIEERPIAPRSPWQNAYAERVIGSLRRECVDHLVVLGERHLRRRLSRYVEYDNAARTHLALYKDAPAGRAVQLPERGRVIERAWVGGLHHEYVRRAA